MIESKSGDLLSDDAEALVNAVNCQGSMDGGIARQFKIRFPEYFRAYAGLCERGEIRLGEVDLYATGNSKPPFYSSISRQWLFPVRGPESRKSKAAFWTSVAKLKQGASAPSPFRHWMRRRRTGVENRAQQHRIRSRRNCRAAGPALRTALNAASRRTRMIDLA